MSEEQQKPTAAQVMEVVARDIEEGKVSAVSIVASYDELQKPFIYSDGSVESIMQVIVGLQAAASYLTDAVMSIEAPDEEPEEDPSLH